MTSLLDAFTQSMTPDAIAKVGEAAGLDATQAQQGLAIVGPLLLTTLAKRTETAGGFDDIMRLLPEEGGGGILARLFGSNDSAALLSKLLGPGASSIVRVITSRLGFDVLPMLAAIAPVLLRTIETAARGRNESATDIAALLKAESAASLERAPAETRVVLAEALQASERAEQLKSTFSVPEWRAIRLSTQAVTNYVVTASPSGLTGMARELLTAGDATAELVKAAEPTSLIDVAFGSVPDEQELGAEGALDQEAPRGSMLSLVHAAAAAVREKIPSEAKAFGDALVVLSRRVAEATKEGGVLGIGGTLVSKEEEQAIAEISGAVEGRLATA